jgi:hypothetical protein
MSLGSRCSEDGNALQLEHQSRHGKRGASRVVQDGVVAFKCSIEPGAVSCASSSLHLPLSLSVPDAQP